MRIKGLKALGMASLLAGVQLAVVLCLVSALPGCTEAQLERARYASVQVAEVADGAGAAVNSPAARTVAPLIPGGEAGREGLAALIAALAALAWTSERFFSWRLKLKQQPPPEKD